MKLEELKNQWNAMSDRVQKLEIINKKNIMEITQQKYRNKFGPLHTIETIGSIICFIMAMAILVNFEKFNTWYLLLCAVISIIALLILPIISLGLLKQIRFINLSKYNYKETIIKYSKARNRVLAFQKGTAVFTFLFMLVALPVADMLLNDNDFFKKEISGMTWVLLGVVSVFLFLFIRWVYGCYKSVTKGAEELLREME